MKLADEKAKKSKSKSKAQQEIPDITAADETPQTPFEMVFVVAPKVYKVFSSLFFNPNQTNVAPLVSWKDFRYAMTHMTHIGFVIEPVDGSEWIFHQKGLPSIKVDDPQGRNIFRARRRDGLEVG